MATAAATRLQRQLVRFRDAALAFCYPPACALCESDLPVDVDSAAALDRHLCSSCLDALAAGPPDRCLRCSAPVGPFLDTRPGCIHCRDDSFAFERVFSIGAYGGALQQACLAAKSGAAAISMGLADLLWRREAPPLLVQGIDLVVPVPHHWTERVTRRHLPPESFGRMFAKRLHVPFNPHILVKTRRTRAQRDLTPTERRANLRNAFACRNANLSGTTLLLSDDVLTTGTTAHRASVELRKAGAARILVAVAARGIGS